MNELKLFTNDELGSVRVVEIENECWFVAMDLTEILEYERTSDLTKYLDDDEKQTVFGGDFKIPSKNNNNNNNIILINESGLYNAILKSNKPNAKQFKKWVTSEVLPSIRKHGNYSTDDFIKKSIENPEWAIDLLTQVKKEREEKKLLNEKLTILQHTNKLYTMTEIAKELGIKSAAILNNTLHGLGIQYKQNDTWIPYSKYADQGFFSIKQEVLDSGRVVYHRKVTQIGREFILNLFQ